MAAMRLFSGLAAVLAIAACTTIPTAPSVLVLPGTGKNFDQFRVDEATCRQYAFESVGGAAAAQQPANAMAQSAVVGTAIGAAAGAAIGGHNSAGVGAGTGLLVGSMAGASAGESSAYGSQQRYDNAYVQCMYAKGHRVPVWGKFTALPPPPPAGTPPPPPPAP